MKGRERRRGGPHTGDAPSTHYKPHCEEEEEEEEEAAGDCSDQAETRASPPSVHTKPPHLVQIHAPPHMVRNWIDSFLKSRREVINEQNIKEFCLPVDKRHNCARVDAVLVKRKDTSSHIRVEHVSNLWGPQIRNEFSQLKSKPGAEEHSYSVCRRTLGSCSSEPAPPTKKKKVYSNEDIVSKLEELKAKYRI